MVDEGERACLVCSTPTTSLHLGMDTCRACSSFFKRARLSGKTFVCRLGDGSCKQKKDGRFTCRKCRYDQCLAVGMVYDAPMRARRCSSSTTNPTAAEELQLQLASDLELQLSTSSPTESILERIGREYDASVERRRVRERAFLLASPDTRRVPHPVHEIYTTGYATTLHTSDITQSETRAFFFAAFPTLAELPPADQQSIFSLYFPKFTMLESYYRTRQIWGGYEDYSMASVLICMDLHRPESWMGKDDGGKNRKELIEAISGYANDQRRLIAPMMTKAQITSNEFHAALALVLCDVDGEVQERAEAALDDIQEEVLEDLQRYYKRDMGLADFSTRLGNLLTLLHTAREYSAMFQTYFRSHIKVFELDDMHENFNELFL